MLLDNLNLEIKPELKTELEERIERARSETTCFFQIHNRPAESPEEIYGEILNNFHLRLPGGNFYKDLEQFKDIYGIDDTTEESYKRMAERWKCDYCEGHSSVHLSKTWRDFFSDVNEACLQAGFEQDQLEQLEVRRERNAVLLSTLAMQFKAYVLLRMKGYNPKDLVA